MLTITINILNSSAFKKTYLVTLTVLSPFDMVFQWRKQVPHIMQIRSTVFNIRNPLPWEMPCKHWCMWTGSGCKEIAVDQQLAATKDKKRRRKHVILLFMACCVLTKEMLFHLGLLLLYQKDYIFMYFFFVKKRGKNYYMNQIYLWCCGTYRFRLSFFCLKNCILKAVTCGTCLILRRWQFILIHNSILESHFSLVQPSIDILTVCQMAQLCGWIFIQPDIEKGVLQNSMVQGVPDLWALVFQSSHTGGYFNCYTLGVNQW